MAERVQHNLYQVSTATALVEGIYRIIEGSDILVAVGRAPNTDGVGLEEAGIKLNTLGFVEVNERLETTSPNVWAMGDCAGSPFFTHVAFDDFRIVRDNLNGGNRTTRDRLVPFCLFTDPELARIGLNEAEAKAKRHRVSQGRNPDVFGATDANAL